MPNNNQTILEFFSRYPNQPYEFVIVTDNNIKEHPNYYKAIFKNIKTDKYHAQEIAPEMMRYKYKVGHIYTNGEHVGQNTSLLKAEFTVNQDYKLKLVPISKLLSNSEAELFLDYKGVKGYFLRQYAHIEYQDDCTLILPCYTIANRFYFISSSMKHAIMSATLDELYYKGSVKSQVIASGETIVKLHIKKKAGKKDLPFLCRFLGSSFARNRLEYISHQKSLTNYDYQPIKAQFPVKHSFDIYASYIYLGDDKNGKPKYLVLNIHSDNSSLGFDKVFYKQYSASGDPKTTDPEEYKVPKKPKKKFKRKKPKRNNQVYTGTPSDEYLKYILYNQEDEYYKNDIQMHGKTIYQENESDPSIEKIDKTVGNSFEKAAAGGDENLGEIEISNDEQETSSEKKIFNLSNFYQFYEALLSFAYVEGSELTEPLDMPQVKKKNQKSFKSKSLLYGDESKPRRFIFGEFAYDKKVAYIVEIEQDKSWGPSTWVFHTSEDTASYEKNDMKDIIEHYIDNDLTYLALEEHVLNAYSLSFARKEHKNGDIDDDTIERWCESVLKKIIHT